MSNENPLEPETPPSWLIVPESDVQVNDVATPKPGKNPEGWTHNYYVHSVSDTHVVLYTAFGSGTVTRLKSDFTYARMNPDV